MTTYTAAYLGMTFYIYRERICLIMNVETGKINYSALLKSSNANLNENEIKNLTGFEEHLNDVPSGISGYYALPDVNLIARIAPWEFEDIMHRIESNKVNNRIDKMVFKQKGNAQITYRVIANNHNDGDIIRILYS